MRNLAHVDPRLTRTCRACGDLFRRDLHRMGRPPQMCPACRGHVVPGDIPAGEIERRYTRALARLRAAGRCQITDADLWRNCTATPPADRGPDTEIGVNFPDAW